MKAVWKSLGLSILGVMTLVVVAVILNNMSVKKSKEPQSASTSKNAIFKGKKTLGLVEVEGVIMDSRPFVKTVKKLVESEKVDGLVIRIDSPGGVVAPSQEMYETLRKLKIPTVCSMGSVAASGGYYLASGCQKIVANPGTITGSIGVIMEMINLQGVYEWAKVKRFALTTGKYKNSGADYKPLADDERKLIQGMIDNVLTQFKNAVKTGRKMSDEEVNAIADGRIFSGEQAKDLKLVDQLGGLEDAIELAGKLAGSDGKPEVIRSHKKKALREILEQLGEEEDEENSEASLNATSFIGGLRKFAKLYTQTELKAELPQTVKLSPGMYVLWRPGVGI